MADCFCQIGGDGRVRIERYVVISLIACLLLIIGLVWISHLAIAVPTSHDLPMIHVSVLSVERNLPWAFIAPPASAKEPIIPKRPSTKETPRPFYIDASMTFALTHTARFPLSIIDSSSDDAAHEFTFIPDADDLPPSDDLLLLPLSTTTLIHVPVNASYTSISMLHLHLLHTVKSPTSSLTIPDTETHKEITHNYHELIVLAAARWRYDAKAYLPLHLGALHVMYLALGRGD
jgi:mediator of RNA polymerase II transcription subunit 13, fungi type